MEYVVIPGVALVASLLAFYSGFGLGTILLPAFAVFFPVNVAIALTAIVHMLNHLFRLALVMRHVDRGIILRFGLAAVAASYGGALLLTHTTALKPLFSYQLAGNIYSVTWIKLAVAVMIIFFALWEALPAAGKIAFSRKYLPIGGLISGFLGGFSGQQGPARSAFLIKSGLDKEGYIATNAAIAVMVDVTRLAVYFTGFSLISAERNAALLAVTTAAGLAGALLGFFFLKKVTMRLVQLIVTIMLVAIGLALGSGLI
jgi:uncharacterized protein